MVRLPCALRRRLVALALGLLFCGVHLMTARADVLLQGFYWDVPSPNAGSATNTWWWDRLATQANALRKAGFTAIWLPPVTKGDSGKFSSGYDPFDDYDIGNKNQKGTIPTRYGNREQLERCVALLRANGLNVYIDLVENHRNGDDGAFHFLYADAFGNPSGGRFQKGPNDFHPNVPQDPNVPEEGSSFGRDLAPVNGGGHWVYNGLIDAGDWLTRALDVQGYRIDYVKGISTDWLFAFLNAKAMQGKFAIGEFFDGNLDKVSNWVTNRMRNRASAFDFPLRFKLKAMCDGHGSFDMSQLDHAGLAGRDPFHAVTWVENHDTDKSDGDKIVVGKALAYAYILTSEGYPCVFYRDYSTDPGCYHLKPVLDKLILIHETLAKGQTQQRWKSPDVFAYERIGGSHLLVGMTDNESASQPITVDTGFGPNKRLHDYTGHAPDVQTDGQGRVSLAIPRNNDGQGYVCYSLAGQSLRLPPRHFRVTQEYGGARDLDLPPADNFETVQICRIWAAAGTPIQAGLFFDSKFWKDTTRLRLTLNSPSGVTLASHDYGLQTKQGESFRVRATTTGWYVFHVQAFDTPNNNAKPAYRLRVTYTAPRTLSLNGNGNPTLRRKRVPSVLPRLLSGATGRAVRPIEATPARARSTHRSEALFARPSACNFHPCRPILHTRSWLTVWGL